MGVVGLSDVESFVILGCSRSQDVQYGVFVVCQCHVALVNVVMVVGVNSSWKIT